MPRLSGVDQRHLCPALRKMERDGTTDYAEQEAGRSELAQASTAGMS